MKIKKSLRARAFTLVAAFVVIVCGFVFALGVIYLCKKLADRTKTIAVEHARRLTNDLDVAQSPVKLPEQDEWIFTPPEDATIEQLEDGSIAFVFPDEEAQRIFDSVGVYSIASSPSLDGPWLVENYPLISDYASVRDIMYQLARQGTNRMGFLKATKH